VGGLGEEGTSSPITARNCLSLYCAAEADMIASIGLS
jgi:hypothetical protein